MITNLSRIAAALAVLAVLALAVVALGSHPGQKAALLPRQVIVIQTETPAPVLSSQAAVHAIEHPASLAAKPTTARLPVPTIAPTRPHPAPATTTATPSPSPTASPPAGIPHGTLDCAGLERLWDDAGGSTSHAFMAAEIAMAESGGRQYAHSPTDDFGYWQINGSHGSMATYDPLGNARAAISISGDGTDWNPWTTYRTGAYVGKC